MTSHVYFVMARGVYEHGPLGMYHTEAEARALAEQHSQYPALHWADEVEDNDEWSGPIDWDRPYTGYYNGDGRHDYVVYCCAVPSRSASAVATLKYMRPEKCYQWSEGVL